MPYLECPGCGLSLYSAASRPWTAESCPVCGASLHGAPKRFPTELGAWTLCREFPSSPGAVAGARRVLDAAYGELGQALHATAVLLISELATNSVKYSRATSGVIEVLACVTPTVLRVEVSNDGEGFGPRPVADDDAESGRGLGLVEELADRWGHPTGLRSAVWFELDRAAAGAAGVPTSSPLRIAT